MDFHPPQVRTLELVDGVSADTSFSRTDPPASRGPDLPITPPAAESVEQTSGATDDSESSTAGRSSGTASPETPNGESSGDGWQPAEPKPPTQWKIIEEKE